MRLLYLSCFLLFIFYWSSFVAGYEAFSKPTSAIILPRDAAPQPTEAPTPEGSSSKKKDENTKKSTRVTTEIDVIYTTIIVASPSSAPTMYNVSDTGSAHQQQPAAAAPASSSPSSGSPDVNDPNKNNAVHDSLKENQAALKRMVLILSLVCGLGVIAIVATLVIFTRMRARSRRQRRIDEEGEGSTFELSADIDRPNTINSSLNNHHHHPGGSGGGGGTSLLSANASIHSSTSTTSSNQQDRPLIEPSAPPALLMIGDDRHSFISKQELGNNRRNILSMSSQTTAPSPSAPTAKELDAMEDEEESGNSSTSSSHHHHHHHASTSATTTTNCSRCTPSLLIAPELPPPAYIPSAPPHYALPVEPIVIEPTTTTTPLALPSRRHSLGG